MSDDPATPGNHPKCGDANTMGWSGTDLPEGKLGLSYMVAGGSTVSNTDLTLADPVEGTE